MGNVIAKILKKAGTLGFLFVFSLSQVEGAYAQGARMTVDEFLNQVRKGHQGFQASEKTIEASEQRADESKLSTRPSLLGTAQYLNDKRETGSPLQGDQMASTSYSLGVKQVTDFGLEAKLLYSHVNMALPGANTAFVPLTSYYTSGPVVELTQSLGRNWLGAETVAAQNVISSQVNANKFGESYKQKQFLAQAESAYWRLAIAREAVAATKETLGRAEKMKQWSGQRAKLNLGNQSDFLQTEANYLARSLELQTALDEERAASRNFNTMRGVDSEVVMEQVSLLDEKILLSLEVPNREQYRDDVKAAAFQKSLAEASSRLGEEKNKPNVSLYGTYGMTGRDADSNEALKEGIKSDHPNYVVGLRVDIPLSLGTVDSIRQGYRKEAMAADLNYKRKVFEQERQWKDLTNQFKDSMGRYQLAQKMEKAQRSKMEFERGRQTKGLTTTFTVLQFEQDYANAQLARLRSQADVVNIYAQLKTFGGGQ
ncbi:MAG: TolC family protein [Bdellovibrionaceae bacterium]|nr:TolC family protein [Pseudobdellovibrionaceae bacterium]